VDRNSIARQTARDYSTAVFVESSRGDSQITAASPAYYTFSVDADRRGSVGSFGTV